MTRFLSVRIPSTKVSATRYPGLARNCIIPMVAGPKMRDGTNGFLTVVLADVGIGSGKCMDSYD